MSGHDVDLQRNFPTNSSIKPTESGTYTVGIRACTSSGTRVCGPYVQSSNSLTKLQAPGDLDVTPHPLRKAVLSWGAVTDADTYEVEANATGEDPETVNDDPDNTDTEYEIELDEIIDSEGLAHEDSFEFTVRASKSGDFLTSEDSDTIAIVDSPINSINADSRGRADNDGQAVIEWESVDRRAIL